MHTDMAAVHAALDQLCDPEIPVVSLREMGILRDVHVSDTGVVRRWNKSMTISCKVFNNLVYRVK